MIFLFQVLIVLFSFFIIKSKGEERLAYFYAALFLIPGNINLTPYVFYLKEHTIFITCFFISLMRYKELDLKDFRKTRIFIPLLLVFIAYLLVGIMDENISVINGIYRGTYVFEGSYFAFLVGWLAFNKNSDFNMSIFLKRFLRFSLITTIFGIITFLMKENPVLNAIGFEDRFVTEYSELEIRSFRVTSFFISSSVYAISCGVLSFLGIEFIKRKTTIDIIAITLLFVNCMLSGTRAGILPIIVLFLLYYVIRFRERATDIIKFLLASLLIGALCVTILPSQVNNVIKQYSTMVMSVVNDDAQEEVNGSSMDARAMQMAAAFAYLEEKPLFGHGIGSSKILFPDGKDEEILGMESYVCFLGIEYGGVFIVCIIIFAISLLQYFYKARYINRKPAICGFCILLCFVLFLIYAWVGDSFIYIMPILGLLARKTTISKTY